LLIMDAVLKLLEDGKWHEIREIIDNSRLNDLYVEMAVGFLSEYDFVKLDKKRRKVRLTPSLYKFVRKIKLIEKEDSVKDLEAP